MVRVHAAFLEARLQGPHKSTLATGVNWLDRGETLATFILKINEVNTSQFTNCSKVK